MPTVYDDALCTAPEVWFEAGDHEEVVHLEGGDFLRLLALHGRFSQRVYAAPTAPRDRSRAPGPESTTGASVQCFPCATAIDRT